ncbi:unnamed protein product, partial [Vitis vinifera]|uniref:Uncharacterized protein n=1 Tax=Vitis vinifera TaxID=29760 RepID=D7U114_VITVI
MKVPIFPKKKKKPHSGHSLSHWESNKSRTLLKDLNIFNQSIINK